MSGARPAEPTPPAGGRAAQLRRLRDGSFDVVVIGGGVTGAGVALDAASRGLKTALVEKGDFASGTSSRSSKLVHGGIRYLQQREFRLVYESLAERQRLLVNAPHLVSPLPFLIPLFGAGGVVSRTVTRSYAIALWLYDLTGGVRIGRRHRRATRREIVEHLPFLDTDRLVAGFVYYDARADDARLTWSLVRTATERFDVVAANYVEVVGLAKDESGAVRGVSVADRAGDGERFEVRAKAVVNATGVWTDEVRALGEPGLTRTLRPAKGVHITVPASRFPADVAAVIPVRKDRRSIFVVPWPDTDLVYLGTTDTAYDGPLDEPRGVEDDVDYLLDAANAVSRADLSRAEVTGVWAGLRPLLAPPQDGRLSERTADLSRRHRVWRDPDGVVTVTGGKLTTYRKMAEDTVDLVVRALGRPARRCATRRLALDGAPEPGDDGALASAQPRLWSRYGTRTAEVLALAEGRPDLLEPAVAGLPYLGAEILYAARHEMAVHLEDVLSRRTRAAVQDAPAAIAAAGRVAAVVAPELGWDDRRRTEEVRRFTETAVAALAAAGIPAPAVVAAPETP